jgi:hypothetical protein
MEVSVALSPGYWSSCRDGSGAGRFGGAASAFADKPTSYKLTKGDAAILRLLGAAEILETDLSQGEVTRSRPAKRKSAERMPRRLQLVRCERLQVDPSRARNRAEAALVRLRAIVGSSRVVQT